MTTKEAIEQSKFVLENLNSGYVVRDKYAIEFHERIIKDLEILEILKESITYQEEYKYIMKGEKFMIFQHTIKGTEKVDKIKEWLKGEGSN